MLQPQPIIAADNSLVQPPVRTLRGFNLILVAADTHSTDTASAEAPVKHTACALFIKERRLLLARRAPHQRRAANCWDVIGGHVEAGETIEEALIREAQEEVGLTPRRYEPAGSMREPRTDMYGEVTYHFFAVTEWEGGEPSMLGDEHTELRWLSIEEACALENLALAGYRDLFRALTSV